MGDLPVTALNVHMDIIKSFNFVPNIAANSYFF